MKNLKYLGLGFVILQAAVLISCGNNKNSDPSGRCDATRNPTGCSSGNVTPQANGDITAQGLFFGQDQYAFQSNAEGLVSATVTPGSLGTVNDGTGTPDNTGIVFGAKVLMSTGQATTAPAGTQVAATSRLMVTVYDSLVGQQASNGQVIGPIEIPLSTASGTAGAGNANVTFKDNFGSIQFEGHYTSTTFTGTVTYTNTTVVGGGTPPPPGIFQFSIPTCSFFVCN